MGVVLAVSLKWFVNREIGRYTICTGTTVLTGWSTLAGPAGWALWLIVVPQIAVAVAALAGLASAAASVLVLFVAGDVRVWTTVLLCVSASILLLGRYKRLEAIARVESALLGAAVVAAAATVFPEPARLAQGLRPTLPPDLLKSEVVPWLAYVLAGAAGLMWYSYWLLEKGYGVPARAGIDLAIGRSDEQRLRGWVRQMTLDNTLAVTGATIIT